MSSRTLKLAALGLVAIHFVVVVLHSIAHQLLSVNASPAQLAFIIPVIVVAPVVAGVMLRKFARFGTVLLTGFDDWVACVRSLLSLHRRDHRPRISCGAARAALLVTNICGHVLPARDLRIAWRDRGASPACEDIYNRTTW